MTTILGPRLERALKAPWRDSSEYNDRHAIARHDEGLECHTETMAAVNPARLSVADARRIMQRRADTDAGIPATANLCMPMWVNVDSPFVPETPAGLVLATVQLQTRRGLTLDIDWHVAWLEPSWRHRSRLYGPYLAAHFAGWVASLGDRVSWILPRKTQPEPMDVVVKVPAALRAGWVGRLKAELETNRQWNRHHEGIARAASNGLPIARALFVRQGALA